MYQKNKIAEKGISNKITDKACLCMGLAASSVINNKIKTKESKGVSVCPGPNMAYFDNILSLNQMTKHIYGVENFMNRDDRPNMFMKELNLYMDFLTNKFEEAKENCNKRQKKYFNQFTVNLTDGITYYDKLFEKLKGKFGKTKDETLLGLDNMKNRLALFSKKLEELNLISLSS